MDKVKVSRAAAALVAKGLLQQSQDPPGVTVHNGVVPLARSTEAPGAGPD